MNKLPSKNTFKNIAIAFVIAIFFISDRVLKNLALLKEEGDGLEIIPNLLSFSFTKNYFISFSLPLFGPFLNIAITLIITALSFYIVYLFRTKKGAKWELILLCALLLGAISNFIDRLAFGFVIDYLELKYFTVFNLADVMISISSFILIIRNFHLKPVQE